jgi:C4-dicarboxylate-specific signal transduction histidine kinase
VPCGTTRSRSCTGNQWSKGLKFADTDHPYVSAILLVLAAFAVRYTLAPILVERSPLLLFTVPVVIASGRYGTLAGLIATALSLVLGILFFMAPRFPPSLSADDVASLCVFLLTSAAMLSFAVHLKASRRRERDLQQKVQLQRTESAMGTLAATLAHELNQPLAAAANYVGAGKRLAETLDGKAQPTVIAGLTEAEGQIRRAGDIVRYARDLVSNPSSAERQRTSLQSIVGSVLKPLQASGTCAGLNLRIEIEPDADAVMVNPIQIEQVLLNLIRNACQAGADDRADSKVVVSGRAQGDFSLVEVRDFGPGIDTQRLPTLFSPVAKPSSGGLGLGLPISRTIIEAHGGKLWAENHRDGGASFYFTVPNRKAQLS